MEAEGAARLTQSYDSIRSQIGLPQVDDPCDVLSIDFYIPALQFLEQQHALNHPQMPLMWLLTWEVVSRLKLVARICTKYNRGRIIFPISLLHSLIDYKLTRAHGHTDKPGHPAQPFIFVSEKIHMRFRLSTDGGLERRKTISILSLSFRQRNSLAWRVSSILALMLALDLHKTDLFACCL